MIEEKINIFSFWWSYDFFEGGVIDRINNSFTYIEMKKGIAFIGD